MNIFIFVTKFFLAIAKGIHNDKRWLLATKMNFWTMVLHEHVALLMTDTMMLESSKSDNQSLKKSSFCDPIPMSAMAKHRHRCLFWSEKTVLCIFRDSSSIFEIILVGCCIGLAQESPQEPKFVTFHTLDTACHVAFFDQNWCKNSLHNSVQWQSTCYGSIRDHRMVNCWVRPL